MGETAARFLVCALVACAAVAPCAGGCAADGVEGPKDETSTPEPVQRPLEPEAEAPEPEVAIDPDTTGAGGAEGADVEVRGAAGRLRVAADRPEAPPDASVSGDGGADTTSDAAGGDAPPAGPPLPAWKPGGCDSDADCPLWCAPVGTCNLEEDRCEYDVQQITGCMVRDDEADTVTCVPPGVQDPHVPCLWCNPVETTTRFTGSYVRQGFDRGLGNFSFVLDFASPEASWTWSVANPAVGAGSLFFGDPGTGTYDTGHPSYSRVAGPFAFGPFAPELPEGLSLTLSFLLWLDTEETPGYDVLRVLVLTASGDEVLLWTSDEIGGTTAGKYVPIEIPLGQALGPTPLFVFEFDTIDSIDNDHGGVYIDQLLVTTGCCSTTSDGEDCDDDDGCTFDLCPFEGGSCEHTPIPGCCSGDGDCDDGNPCTADDCVYPGGSCEHVVLAGCCVVAADCDDGDPCTEDACSGAAGTCIHTPLCCAHDVDCEDGDPCTAGTCKGGQCAFSFVCCAGDAECDDGDGCTGDACVEGACVHSPLDTEGCCSPSLLVEGFDGGPPPTWTFTPPSAGVSWSIVDTPLAMSPPSALYYGNPFKMNYSSGVLANEGSATTAPIALPAGSEVHLTFQVFLDIEPGFDKDLFRVEALTPSGSASVAPKYLFSQGAWTAADVDVSFLAGETVSFVFRFETVDESGNEGLGVLVDDVAVTTTCAKKLCTTDAGCADPDPCTVGFCHSGSCVWVSECCETDADCDDLDACTVDLCEEEKANCLFEPIAGCCSTVADCDDGSPCTLDYCSGFGGECSHESISGCCETDAGCDDGDACSIDACTANACVHTTVCCEVDGDCDDGDPVCTSDHCVLGTCTFEPTEAPGCCDETPLAWDFETPIDFAFTETVPPCSWHFMDSPLAYSGQRVLHYGNLESGDFACEKKQHAGSALSPPVTLAPGFDHTLTFALDMDVESAPEYDQLYVVAVLEEPDPPGFGTELVLWEKTALGGVTAKWQVFAVDVSALSGETFRLRFDFDTVDAILNDTGAGVYLDDVRITSTCDPVVCTSDKECDDGLTGTFDACDLEANACAWVVLP